MERSPKSILYTEALEAAGNNIGFDSDLNRLYPFNLISPFLCFFLSPFNIAYLPFN